MSAQAVAFIGLGIMGLPMAQNVQRDGHAVRVYDVVPAARERARESGLAVAESMTEVLAGASLIVTMLPDTPQVDEVLHAEDGILALSPRGSVLVDMSSISPLAAQAYAAEAAEFGITMLDGPVSGGVHKAISGELSIMLGGDVSGLEKAKAVLDSMGSAVHMGVAGTGQATKVCNQVAVTLTIQAAAEAFALGSKLGVDLTRLHEALLGGSCNSFILENLGPLMLAGDDDPGFRIALQVKDLRIAQDSALRTATPLPGLSTVLNLYLDAMNNGQAGDGNQSLSRVYERMTGATIGAIPRAS